MRLYTIGHSNRGIEEFIALLKEFEIRSVADVRRYPSSRKFPHFNRGLLEERLERERIEYAWFEALGGRRHGGKGANSPNDGIDSPAFRNYADYMLTGEFHAAVSELVRMGDGRTTAVMCAEKFFGNCHRKLLSDYLKSRGVEVVHIMEEGKSQLHEYSSIARITKDNKVIYPSPLFNPPSNDGPPS